MNNIVQSVYYNEAENRLKYDIAALFHRVWPRLSPPPGTIIPTVHATELHVRSFYIYSDGKIVSYAGVLQQTIRFDGHSFQFAGLSCVGTDPDYRREGLGSLVVSVATEWIENKERIDFGLLTCEPVLANFYHLAGAWEVAQDIVLVANDRVDALSSEHLHVVVLMRIFSEKAKKHEDLLRNTTINIDFPDGEFL